MYTMRRTPRSSFMVGTGGITIQPTPVYVPPPRPPSPKPNYLTYALVGTGVLVAYLTVRRFRKR